MPDTRSQNYTKRNLTFAASLPLLAALALCMAAGARAKARHVVDEHAAVAVNNSPVVLDLKDYGAAGDGITDDGPALQSALDALADAGGGTLLVPAGRYAIVTPVVKSFAGLDASVTISGVPSNAPVAPPDAPVTTLSHGLALTTEFLPRTETSGDALTLSGLRAAVVKEIAFVGTPDIDTDARDALSFYDVDDASVTHCEFYGLSSSTYGASVLAVRSRLRIERSIFLGCTANSGAYTSVVMNLEWKGFTIEEAIFLDYGLRPELFSKTGLAAPQSWVQLGNAAALTNDSPRREAVFRSIFMDEGGLTGISSLPDRYTQPPSAPIDLVYVTGLRMNVSNLGTSGHYLTHLRAALVEDSVYGWSLNADSAINLIGVGHAIIDRIETEAAATRLRADATTERLTVIDSVYTDLASLSPQTFVINTNEFGEDPVPYVRERFESVLGRAPDAAAHFYWSDRILRCDADAVCDASARAALDAYLAASPSETFEIQGRVADDDNSPLAGVAVALTGSQSVSTVTDADGLYHFSNLPTSGLYNVKASKRHYAFAAPSQTFTTPATDVHGDFAAVLERHTISGRVTDDAGRALAGAILSLTGSQSATTTSDSNGDYIFDGLAAGGAYNVTASKADYTFAPASVGFTDLSSDARADFQGTPTVRSIFGFVVNVNNGGMQGIPLTLTGSRTATTTTAADGSYRFDGLPVGGSYVVKPKLFGYLFSPTSRSFDNLSADSYAGFVGGYVEHRIQGRVAQPGGAAVSGVTVALAGSKTGTTTTDSNGSYTFDVPSGGDYTVTASKAYFTITPPTQTFTEIVADKTADFAAALINYRVGGRVTENGSGLGGVTVALTGSQSASATTADDGSYSFAVPAEGDYTVTAAKTNYAFAPKSQTFVDLGGDKTADFAATHKPVVEFGAAVLSVGEGGGTLEVTVTRSGDTSEEVSAIYEVQSGTAVGGSDVVGTTGRITFAPGETTKTFTLFITDDTHVEGSENFSVKLTPEGEAVAGERASVAVTINDNDTDPTAANAIDDPEFFVREHYRDFLSREPDDAGLAFWTKQITSCGADAACREVKRINVSAAFFLSIEFQETGFFVYKSYRAAYGETPNRLGEFTLDSRDVSAGVVVGNVGWEQKLALNKEAYLADFVARDEFEEEHPLSLTPAQFVSALDANAGGSLTTAERDAATAEFGGAQNTANLTARARVLRLVVDNAAFHRRETNPAFVLMQYFGYMRREPDESGFDFWLKKLEDFDGDFRRAEMVKAFISSDEYRERFGR
jgi:hypothetical protein